MAFIISDVCVFDADGAYVRTVRQVIPIDCNGVAGAPTSYIDGASITTTAPALAAGQTLGSCSCVESLDLCELMQDATTGQTVTAPVHTDKLMVIDTAGACQVRELPGPAGLVWYSSEIAHNNTVFPRVAPYVSADHLSPLLSFTNTSAINSAYVKNEFWEDFYVDVYVNPAHDQNFPTVIRFNTEISYNGGPWTPYSETFHTLPDGWSTEAWSRPRNYVSNYVAPGATFSVQFRSRWSVDQGTIDAGGAVVFGVTSLGNGSYVIL